MDDSTPRAVKPRPLWEEFNGSNLNDLIGLMAEEMWERTGSPACAAAIAEAELAHVRAGGSWQTYLTLESLYRDEATAKGCQCAVFGFCLAFRARDKSLLGGDPGRWFDRTMKLAEIVPVSDEARIEYGARRDLAMDECQRLRQEPKNRQEKIG